MHQGRKTPQTSNNSSPALPSQRVLTGGTVILAHAVALAVLINPPPASQTRRQAQDMTATLIEIADQSAAWDTVPLPDIQLVTPTLDADSLKVVSFEDPEDDAGVVGSASSPRLSRLQYVRPEFFARKAGVQRPQTVVLAVLVLEDGRVGDVQVTRSSGNADVDAAAIEYTRALRWIPGTKDHQPQAMRISFPVILTSGV